MGDLGNKLDNSQTFSRENGVLAAYWRVRISEGVILGEFGNEEGEEERIVVCNFVWYFWVEQP